jgi:catechol 2,3-dioxygenase-like lactoylglutathione lyase family enzyme
MTTNFVQVTPFLRTNTLGDTIAFYRDVLGFGLFVSGGGYAYLERERVGLRLLELDTSDLVPARPTHIYIDVHDADALFNQLTTALKILPQERFGAPKDQPYGQREFWVRDPNGHLITFGQGIGNNATQWDYRG